MYFRFFLIVIEVIFITVLDYKMAEHYYSLDVLYCLPVIQVARFNAFQSLNHGINGLKKKCLGPRFKIGFMLRALRSAKSSAHIEKCFSRVAVFFHRGFVAQFRFQVSAAFHAVILRRSLAV